jgi:hypothetical protein
MLPDAVPGHRTRRASIAPPCHERIRRAPAAPSVFVLCMPSVREGPSSGVFAVLVATARITQSATLSPKRLPRVLAVMVEESRTRRR